jgi:hypothetical protein
MELQPGMPGLLPRSFIEVAADINKLINSSHGQTAINQELL